MPLPLLFATSPRFTVNTLHDHEPILTVFSQASNPGGDAEMYLTTLFQPAADNFFLNTNTPHQHIPSVMDSVPEGDRCQCGPKVEVDGKEYPRKADKAD